MFDAHASVQGVIVGALLLRQWPCFGFLAGNIVRVMVLKSLIATISVDVTRRRQGWPAPPDFEIMDPAGRGLGNGDDAENSVAGIPARKNATPSKPKLP